LLEHVKKITATGVQAIGDQIEIEIRSRHLRVQLKSPSSGLEAVA
jgi:hypothetical protein